MVDNPLELYNQMFSHGIGTLCAIFYRSWADELFLNDDFKRADRVYKNGLQVKAQPLEELETAHANFQLAVARRILDTTHNVSETKPPERRKAGNVLNTFGSKHKVTSQRIGSHVSQHYPGVLKPKNDATVTKNTHQEIKVFDEEDAENNMPKSNLKMQTGPKHQTLVKENTKKAGPWNGIQVKTSIEHVKMKPTFPVHEENLSPQRNHYKAEERLSALKPKKMDVWLCPLAIFEPPDPSKRAMYPKDKVYSGGTEYSLEELRAVRYLRRKREKKDFCTIDVKQTSVMESNGNAKEDRGIIEICSNVNSGLPKNCSEQDEIPASLPPYIAVMENCTAKSSETVDIKPKQSNAPAFTLFIDEEDCPQVINSHERATCTTSESTSNVPQNVSCKENVFSRQLTNFVEQPVCRKEQKFTECITTASMLKISKRKHTTSDKTENGQQASEKTTDSVFKVPAKQDSSIHSHTVNTEDVLKVVNECWTTPKQKKVDDDWAAERRGAVVKEKLFLDVKSDVEIPRVPSPGMNQAELDGLEGTENKENDIIKPFHIQNDSDNEELAQPLDLENTFKKPFDKVKTPANEDNWFQRGNQSGRFLDDTCTTQMFSQTLISSTPIRKSLKLIKQENLHMPTKLQIENDSCIRSTEPNPNFTKIETNSCTEPNRNLTRVETNSCIEPNPNFTRIETNSCTEPDPKFTKTEKIRETLSIILENSKEYKSSISSGSSSVVTRETYNLVQSWRESHALTSELSKISEVSLGSKDLESSKSDVKSVTIRDKKCCPDNKSDKTVKSLDCIPDGDIDPFDHILNKNILKYYNYPDKSDATIITDARNLPKISVSSTVHLGGSNYRLSSVLGEGAYAKVYCGLDENKHKYALKVLKEVNLWELYISSQIKKRLKNESLATFFLFPLQSYVFSDGVIFSSECYEMGTLLNIINLWKKNITPNLPECLCFYFTCELLKILQILHGCKIIHADFKADNILVKSVFPLSLKLTDFGRSIDLNAFPEGTKFNTVITTDDMKCIEMRSKLPWTYQVDYFGLVGIVHCLIFGDYIKVLKKGSWNISSRVQRWFKRDKWDNFFQDFLNIESCEKLPDLAYWIEIMTTELQNLSADLKKAESQWMKIKC